VQPDLLNADVVYVSFEEPVTFLDHQLQLCRHEIVLEVDAYDIRDVQSVELALDRHQLGQRPPQDLLGHLLALIVGSEHGDGLDRIEGVEAVDDGPIARSAVVGQRVVDGDDLPRVELCLSLVVQHLHNVSELLAEGRNAGHGCDHRREGLGSCEGQQQAHLCLVVSPRLLRLGQRVQHFGITADLHWVCCRHDSIDELVFDCRPEYG
jgi:hypothetical protein